MVQIARAFLGCRPRPGVPPPAGRCRVGRREAEKRKSWDPGFLGRGVKSWAASLPCFCGAGALKEMAFLWKPQARGWNPPSGDRALHLTIWSQSGLQDPNASTVGLWPCGAVGSCSWGETGLRS